MINLHRKSELLKGAISDIYSAELRLELAIDHESQLPGGNDGELRGIVAQLQVIRSQLAGVWDAAVVLRDGTGGECKVWDEKDKIEQ